MKIDLSIEVFKMPVTTIKMIERKPKEISWGIGGIKLAPALLDGIMFLITRNIEV